MRDKPNNTLLLKVLKITLILKEENCKKICSIYNKY